MFNNKCTLKPIKYIEKMTILTKVDTLVLVGITNRTHIGKSS